MQNRSPVQVRCMRGKKKKKEGEVPHISAWLHDHMFVKMQIPRRLPRATHNLSFKKFPRWFWGMAESETPVSGLGRPPAPEPPRVPFFLTCHLSAKRWAPAWYLTSLQCCFLEGGERWRESCLRPALPSALGLESCRCQPRPSWVDSCPPSARPCFLRDPTVQAQSCARFCG